MDVATRFVGVEFAVEPEEVEGEPREAGDNPCFNAVLVYGRRACGPVIAFRTGSENSVSVAIAVNAAYTVGRSSVTSRFIKPKPKARTKERNITNESTDERTNEKIN